MKVIVCGGRDYNDYTRVCDTLNNAGITFLIHGAARGADSLAHKWAKESGVSGVACPANWGRDGKRAGPIRNQRMLDMGPDLVIAFPGGRGTEDMIARSQKSGVKVMRVEG